MTNPAQEQTKMNCSKHGEYQSTKHDILGKAFYSKCPKCVQDVETSLKAEEGKIEWLSKRRSNMRISNYKINNPQQRAVVERVSKFVVNFDKVKELGSCMVFIGNPGTGKTHLATAVGVDLHLKGYSVGYYRLYDLMARIKATYGRGATETEGGVIKAISEFDLVILDEVGLKTFTETEIALTYQIIDKRYEAVRPTLIVSNLSMKDLEENLGSRTIDRLFENHGAVLVFDWESMRRNQIRKDA